MVQDKKFAPGSVRSLMWVLGKEEPGRPLQQGLFSTARSILQNRLVCGKLPQFPNTIAKPADNFTSQVRAAAVTIIDNLDITSDGSASDCWGYHCSLKLRKWQIGKVSMTVNKNRLCGLVTLTSDLWLAADQIDTWFRRLLFRLVGCGEVKSGCDEWLAEVAELVSKVR
jgi:hypothetical protein